MNKKSKMDDLCQQTMQMFGSLLQTPVLSKEELVNPSFKYIFDIITETTNITGYARGLYQGEELNCNYYDNLDKKITYFQKIIDLTQKLLNEVTQADPYMILGQWSFVEPWQPHIMLQAIYRAATSGLNSDEIVQKIHCRKVTVKMFSSLIEKPKMSEKLLDRPPFKYIFDIIMETINVTCYGKGLYHGDELQHTYYDNRDKKIFYLWKIINLTQLFLEEEIQAMPAKIVSGLEPEQTNLMLQAIYRAAISGKNSDVLVQKILCEVSDHEEIAQAS